MKVDFINKLLSLFKKPKIEAQKKGKSAVSPDVLQKNFLKQENKHSPDFEEDMSRRKHSMIDSQGVSDFSGSGYNGPGNVDREKINSNMGHRNYQVRD